MKRQITLAATLAAFTMALIVFIASCSKSNNSASFIGKYAGTLSYSFYHEPDTITITAGSTSADIVMNSRTAAGAGSAYTIHGTVSGSTLSIAAQSVYIPSQSATYTVSGAGTLTGSSLTINYTFVSSSQSSTNWTFTGTRM